MSGAWVTEITLVVAGIQAAVALLTGLIAVRNQLKGDGNHEHQ